MACLVDEASGALLVGEAVRVLGLQGAESLRKAARAFARRGREARGRKVPGGARRPAPPPRFFAASSPGWGRGKGLETEAAVGRTLTRRPSVGSVTFSLSEHNGIKDKMSSFGDCS